MCNACSPSPIHVQVGMMSVEVAMKVWEMIISNIKIVSLKKWLFLVKAKFVKWT